MADDRGMTSTTNVPDAGAAPPAPPAPPDSTNVGADANMGIGSGGSTPAPVGPQAGPQAAPAAPGKSGALPVMDVGQIHKSLFGKIFEGLGGGPQRVTVTDPNTGLSHIEMRHAKNGQIMKSVLAGAITGMLAGASVPNQTMDTAQGPVQVDQPMQSLAAGGQAVAKQRADMQANAQREQDTALSRQYSVLKQNLEIHKNQLQNAQLGWEADKHAIDEASPIITGMENWGQAHGVQVIRAKGVRGSDLMSKYHVTQDSALPDGRIPVMGKDGKVEKNPDGTDKYEVTYTVFDPMAMVRVDDDIKNSEFGKDNPAIQQLPNNSAVAARVLVDAMSKAQTSAIAQSTINGLLKRAAELQGEDEPKDVKLNDLVKKDPYLAQIVPYIGKYAGLDPDVALDQMEKDHPEMVGHLAAVLNVDRAKLAAARKLEDKSAQLDAKLRSGPLTDQSAATILADPQSPPELQRKAQAFLDIRQKVKDEQEKHKLAADQAVKQGDPKTAGQMLFDGTLTLSELKARSATPKFIADVTTAAQAIARANGVYDWTPQNQEAQFNVAKSPSNQLFMTSANSLLEANGTLDQLRDQTDKLLNMKIPKFNDWKNFIAYNVGDPALAGFKQTVLGVADDYAKVMGGGVGSDSSRLEIINSFASAHNPEQMEAAIDAARKAVASQVRARIGKNRIMFQLYGDTVPGLEKDFPPIKSQVQAAASEQGGAANQVPPGKVPAYLKGKLIGYADDNKGTNYHQF